MLSNALGPATYRADQIYSRLGRSYCRSTWLAARSRDWGMCDESDAAWLLEVSAYIGRLELASTPRTYQNWCRIVRVVLGWKAPRRRGNMRLATVSAHAHGAIPWRAWLRFVRLLIVQMACDSWNRQAA